MSDNQTVKRSVSFTKLVADWADELAQKRGHGNNFSAFMADLVRREKDREEARLELRESPPPYAVNSAKPGLRESLTDRADAQALRDAEALTAQDAAKNQPRSSTSATSIRVGDAARAGRTSYTAHGRARKETKK